jgi:hypothetical protein
MQVQNQSKAALLFLLALAFAAKPTTADDVQLPPESATAVNYQVPSISMEDANRYFRMLQPLTHESQSYHRAQVWSHELARNAQVKTMTAFLFFTNKFQKTYAHESDNWLLGKQRLPFAWWFMSAPYVIVDGQEMVLDREFFDRPVTMHEWTHFFLTEYAMRTSNVGAARLSFADTNCPVIKKFQETFHENGQDWCMLRKVPMYYAQPNSVEALDCDPTQDPARGKPASRLMDGRLKYPCAARPALNDFDPHSIENAYDNAKPRK